jgi:hypothetical protein
MSVGSDTQPLWRLLLRRPKRERTAFVAGDATGSTFRNITTDADDFARGDTGGSAFENIDHKHGETP